VRSKGERSSRTPSATGEVDVRQVTLGRAWDVLDSLRQNIAAGCPIVDEIVLAGDARRFEPLVSQPCLVLRSADRAAAIEQLNRITGATKLVERTAGGGVIRYRDLAIDVQIAEADDFGSTLFRATGSAAHVAAVLGRHRLFPARSEEEFYSQAGLAFIAPELRNASGEVEAAENGTLPVLVSCDDVRGDLHMHTTYSDGGDSLADMVMTCHGLGYEYIAITDHSQGAAASRTMSASDIARQREEIERLRERAPGMTILHGAEVDILPDGSLDFSDEVLEQFDIVLASLHESAGHDGARLTERCLAAIRHPLVNVLTHPMNRLVGRRDGYDLDYEAVYAAAVETGTALEIDGAPSHLDLDGEHARAAAAAGVIFTTDSDCHRAPLLERQMRFAIGTARRGWVVASQVLNTRPVEAIRAFIRAKRSRSTS